MCNTLSDRINTLRACAGISTNAESSIFNCVGVVYIQSKIETSDLCILLLLRIELLVSRVIDRSRITRITQSVQYLGKSPDSTNYNTPETFTFVDRLSVNTLPLVMLRSTYVYSILTDLVSVPQVKLSGARQYIVQRGRVHSSARDGCVYGTP